MLGALGWLVGAASPASAATTCTGTISNQTLSAVTVPWGASCVLQHVTVKNDVKASGPYEIDVLNSLVKGDLIINGSSNYGGQSDVSCSTIRGNVKVKNMAPNDEFAMDGGHDEPPECGPNTVGGNVTLSNNQGAVDVELTSIGGNLSATGNGNVAFEDNTVYQNRSCSNNGFVSVEENPDTVFGSDNCVDEA